MDPWIAFVLILLVGIIAGVIAERGFRRSWLSRQVGATTRSDVTAALVGIAGSFIGWHLAAMLIPAASTVVLLIGAILGAALILWGWKALRL